MTTSSAKFAFQINPQKQFSELQTNTDELIIGSKKEQIKCKDGSTKNMIVFFVAHKDSLDNFQRQGVARSKSQTLEDFRKFCMAQNKDLTTTQFAHSMRTIKNADSSLLVAKKKNFFDDIRLDYDRKTELSYNILAKNFSKASESGLLMRVANETDDSASLIETDYVAPKKNSFPPPTEGKRRILQSDSVGLAQPSASVNSEITGMHTEDKSSQSLNDPNDRLVDSKPIRHPISREKHIHHRRVDRTDISQTAKTSET